MDKEKMIRGAGSTCIFSHNSHLSQCVLEGKHPSSTYCIKFDLFINFVDFKAQKKMIRGTLQGNAVCACGMVSEFLANLASQKSLFDLSTCHCEPSRFFLTVSTAPFTEAYYDYSLYKTLVKEE